MGGGGGGGGGGEAAGVHVAVDVAALVDAGIAGVAGVGGTAPIPVPGDGTAGLAGIAGMVPKGAVVAVVVATTVVAGGVEVADGDGRGNSEVVVPSFFSIPGALKSPGGMTPDSPAP